MSDVVGQVPEVDATETVDVVVDEGKTTLTYEELAAELAKTRKEAADRRVKNRDAEAKLVEYDAWKASQMTELEKAQAETKREKEERKADLVELALTKFGLDVDDAEYVSGETKEAILASAEKLAKRLGKTAEDGTPVVTTNSPNLFPGLRGKPVGSGSAADANTRLRNELWGQ